MRVFQLIDSDNKGIIDVQDLKRIAKEIGENMTEEELQELVQDCYECPSGKTDIDSFYKMMIKNVF